MAKQTKKTKVAEPVNEEIKQEVLTNAEVETVKEEPVVEPEVTNEATETVVDAEEVKEVVEEEKPVEEVDNADAISSERIVEIAEKLKAEGESLKEINEITPETENVLKKKISELEKMEDELRQDIEKTESELGQEDKAAAERLFRRGFTEFWNGVSDGWNN